jgi:hypothetical protein
MSAGKETNDNVVKVNTESSLTVEQLLRMMLDQNKETAASNKALAEAIVESRKPYVDPRVVAAREQARKDRKMLIDQELRKREAARRGCGHLNEGGRYNIKWMQHSDGIILGVCGNCFTQFDATHNAKDADLLRKDQKSIRNMGRAGEHARKGISLAV